MPCDANLSKREAPAQASPLNLRTACNCLGSPTKTTLPCSSLRKAHKTAGSVAFAASSITTARNLASSNDPWPQPCKVEHTTASARRTVERFFVGSTTPLFKAVRHVNKVPSWAPLQRVQRLPWRLLVILRHRFWPIFTEGAFRVVLIRMIDVINMPTSCACKGSSRSYPLDCTRALVHAHPSPSGWRRRLGEQLQGCRARFASSRARSVASPPFGSCCNQSIFSQEVINSSI